MNWIIDLSRAPLRRKNGPWENGISFRLSPPYMLFHRQLFSSNSHWCAFFISRNQSITRLISFQKHDEKTTVFRDHCFQEFGPGRGGAM
jgi:hypothetical protein